VGRDFENVFVYVADALRLDSVPEAVKEKSERIVPTLAPAAYTPISFTSLATGRQPSNHSVRSFYDTIQRKTVLDRFENSCYFDHPDGALSQNVFKDTERTTLPDTDTPFFYLERAMETHRPYGVIGHGNKVPSDPPEYANTFEGYRKGVPKTGEHFLSHVKQLEERGILEDTLVIFTADHGELLGQKKLLRKRGGHNKPLCRKLCVVPTVFLNYDAGFERMRTVDLAPTAASLTGRKFEVEGMNLENRQPRSGETMLQINTSPLLTASATWRWRNNEWRRDRFSGAITDLATLGIDVLNPVRKKIRETRIADILRPDKDAETIIREDDELRGIDV
jgi:hypothetical protein